MKGTNGVVECRRNVHELPGGHGFRATQKILDGRRRFRGCDRGLDFVVHRSCRRIEYTGIELPGWIEDVADAHRTIHGFPGHSEDLGDHVLDTLTLFDSFLEQASLIPKLGIRHAAERGFMFGDIFNDTEISFDETIITSAKNLLGHVRNQGDAHGSPHVCIAGKRVT